MTQDIYKGLFVSPRGSGKTWDIVKKLVESFLESGKSTLKVEFVTPDILELQKINHRYKEALEYIASGVRWSPECALKREINDLREAATEALTIGDIKCDRDL